MTRVLEVGRSGLWTHTPMKLAVDGRNGRTSCSPCFRYFRISNVQDRVDALQIYGGEQIWELVETLEDVSLPSPAENLDEYEKILAKLENHLVPMVNLDCARSKLEMSQNEGESYQSVSQYHVRLRLQVEKCGFTDPNYAIRSKILQTMRDKKLRREAMVQRYTLQHLYPVPSPRHVNRVHPRRPHKSKNKQRPKPSHGDKKNNIS